MKTKTLFYGLAGLLTSSTLAGLVILNNAQAQVSNSKHNTHHPSKQTTPVPQRRMMMGEVDQHFIEMMIPHHEDAIEMAELALSRAKRPEIKKLAQAIIKDQNREIEQMRSWYKKWYGTEVPATPMAGMGMRMHQGRGEGMNQGMMRMSMHPDMQMHLDTLKNSSDFDREFIREMIPHHQMAVMMSRMVVNSGTHPELRNLAQSIIKAQTSEINQMQQWYQAWYKSQPEAS
jgi:uncharacterized protein (DUF305 family)